MKRFLMLLLFVPLTVSAFTLDDLAKIQGRRDVFKIKPEKFAQLDVVPRGEWIARVEMASGSKYMILLKRKSGDPDILPLVMVPVGRFRIVTEQSRDGRPEAEITIGPDRVISATVWMSSRDARASGLVQ